MSYAQVSAAGVTMNFQLRTCNASATVKIDQLDETKSSVSAHSAVPQLRARYSAIAQKLSTLSCQTPKQGGPLPVG
jgi:hypothetical protein